MHPLLPKEPWLYIITDKVILKRLQCLFNSYIIVQTMSKCVTQNKHFTLKTIKIMWFMTDLAANVLENSGYPGQCWGIIFVMRSMFTR